MGFTTIFFILLDYFARLYQKDFVILWAETNIIKIDMKKILLSRGDGSSFESFARSIFPPFPL